MKRAFIFALVFGISPGLLAQGDGEPCCNVIHIDATKNLVSVREKASGRIYLFRPDAMDLRALKNGDAANVTNGKITSLSGATRTYMTIKPDYGEPCCSVVTIQPDGAQPCCAVVAVSNSATNQNYNVSVPREVVGKFKVGQSVVNDPNTGLAIFQTGGGTDGNVAAYGYPIEGGSADEKWIVSPNTLKGSSGRLLFDNPVGSVWDLYIYNAADDKYITSYANVNNKGLVTVAPGQYKITINNAPVLNVPIKKGHDTRLKCGLLDVVSNGVWYLKDATGKTSHTSGNKPVKILVPVGNYIFELEGQNQPCVIKNGEVTEM